MFDFALVAEREPEQLEAALGFLTRHIDTILVQLEHNVERLKMQFDAIATLEYTPTYEYASEVLRERLLAFRAA